MVQWASSLEISQYGGDDYAYDKSGVITLARLKWKCSKLTYCAVCDYWSGDPHKRLHMLIVTPQVLRGVIQLVIIN